MPIQTICTCSMSLTGFCARDIRECKNLFLTEMDNCYQMEEKKYQDCPLCGTPCEVIHEHQLADFSFIMEQVPKVYCHITGNKISKIMYRADTVIAVADDYFQEQLEEAVKEETESVGAAWVKASEFKTHVPVWRPYRKPCLEDEGEYDYGEIYVTEDDGRVYLDVDNESNYEYQSDERWKDYEILDESGPAPLTQSRADLIREANGRDLGGIESDAVAFAEWIDSIAVRVSATQWRVGGGSIEAIATTAELYEQFQNRNNENS